MKTTSLKVKAYNSLKEKIIHGIYAPGQYLNENLLMEELNIGRTPIKDALGRLEQEGLIEIKPKKGVIVTSLSLQDINMIFEMRLLYEPYIVKHYGNLIPEKELLHFYNIFTNTKLDHYSKDQDKYYSLDADFHQMIITASPNTYIHRCYAMIQTQSERFRYMTGKISDKRIADTFTEHLQIVNPLIKKDWDKAQEQLIHHLNQSKKATMQLIMENADRISII